MPFRLLWMLLAVLAARGQFTVRPVATGPSDQDYPAIASGHDRRTWAAWVDYDGEGDAIPLVPLDAGSPGSDIQMIEGHGVCTARRWRSMAGAMCCVCGPNRRQATRICMGAGSGAGG